MASSCSPYRNGEVSTAGCLSNIMKEAQSLFREGMQLYSKKDNATAIEKLSHAIELDPNTAEYFVLRRDCYRGMNMKHEAVKDGIAVLRLKERKATADDHSHLIECLRDLRDLNSAKEALLNAKKIFPTEQHCWAKLSEELSAAEIALKLSRDSRTAYESREQVAREKDLLCELSRLWENSKQISTSDSPTFSATSTICSCPHNHLENFGDKSLGVQGAVFVCSGCRTTITEESHPTVIAQEKESMQRLGEQDLSEPEDSADRGLTIGFILLLCEHFNLWNWTTRDVLLNFVVPITCLLRCRFVDLSIFSTSRTSVVGRADTFISHCFSALFGDMVAAICDGGADLNRRVWIDIFAVRQWASVKHDLQFEKVIERCPSFLIICSSLQEVHDGGRWDLSSLRPEVQAKIPFFRVWCLYEVFYAAHFHKTIVLKGGSFHLRHDGEKVFLTNSDMLYQLSRAMDINKASTTNKSDMEMIFQKIAAFPDGVDGMNDKVKEVIKSAYLTTSFPVLQSAACGDEVAKAILKEMPERYLPHIVAGGFITLLSDIIASNKNLLEWRDSSGRTPLMLVTERGSISDTKQCLDQGADIHAKDRSGNSALRYARLNHHDEVAKYLLSKGAKNEN